MDTPEKARRPWWFKKRWWAAGLLWLLLVYPLTVGGLRYAIARGWVSSSVREIERPADFVFEETRLRNSSLRWYWVAWGSKCATWGTRWEPPPSRVRTDPSGRSR